MIDLGVESAPGFIACEARGNGIPMYILEKAARRPVQWAKGACWMPCASRCQQCAQGRKQRSTAHVTCWPLWCLAALVMFHYFSTTSYRTYRQSWVSVSRGRSIYSAVRPASRRLAAALYLPGAGLIFEVLRWYSWGRNIKHIGE